MKFYAVVKDGIVVNLVIWDSISDYSPGDQCSLVLVPDGILVGMGWVFDGTSFKDPNAP